MPFDHIGQGNGQFAQISYIKETVAVNTFNVFFVISNGCRHKNNTFFNIFSLNTTQILLSRSSALADVRRLPVRDEDQDFDIFTPFG